MIDTIACLATPLRPIDDACFGGGSMSMSFDEDIPMVKARLWLNPESEGYAPRITYWRDASIDPFTGEAVPGGEAGVTAGNGVLKVEFSVPKMVGLDLLATNPTSEDVALSLDMVTAYVRRHFGDDFPHVREWRTQRVDYAWQWDVDDLLPAYMSVMHKLRVRTYQRHPFEASEGVVWKSKGRWVKFYNKARERGYKHGTVLRFEVSNYRDAVRRMARDWYGTHRGVSKVVQPGRALYVMARIFDTLGLTHDQGYGHREYLLYRMRDVYGVKNLPRALHALRMIHEFGTASFADDIALMSRSTYYSWKKKLTDAGFLVVADDDDTAREQVLDLPPLQLPINIAFTTQNLADLRTQKQEGGEKNFWKKGLAPALKLAHTAPQSDYLMRAI